jgi:hypothetical protein
MASRIPLFNFAYHPYETWEKIASVAKPEPWGKERKILEWYLRANFEIAKAQNKVFENKQEGVAFWRAGSLVNLTSDPIWAVYRKNKKADPFWCFDKAVTGDPPVPGTKPADYQLVYDPPSFERDWAIHFEQWNIQHILQDPDNRARIERAFKDVFAKEVNGYLVFRAIYGELQLKRKEEAVLPQWYHGDYQFLMPLCLVSPDKVDLTATLSPDPALRRYSVRTLLLPHYAYASARAIIKSRTAFADWMMLSDEELNAVTIEDDSET